MSQEGVERVSRAIYDNSYMLQVATAIAAHPKEKFLQKDLVSATGLDKGLVATVVKRLESAKYISRLPREGREQPFHRTPTVFWELASMHLDEAESW